MVDEDKTIVEEVWDPPMLVDDKDSVELDEIVVLPVEGSVVAVEMICEVACEVIRLLETNVVDVELVEKGASLVVRTLFVDDGDVLDLAEVLVENEPPLKVLVIEVMVEGLFPFHDQFQSS